MPLNSRGVSLEKRGQCALTNVVGSGNLPESTLPTREQQEQRRLNEAPDFLQKFDKI